MESQLGRIVRFILLTAKSHAGKIESILWFMVFPPHLPPSGEERRIFTANSLVAKLNQHSGSCAISHYKFNQQSGGAKSHVANCNQNFGSWWCMHGIVGTVVMPQTVCRTILPWTTRLIGNKSVNFGAKNSPVSPSESDQISSHQVFETNNRKFPECTNFTRHYLSGATLSSRCVVSFALCWEFPSI